MLTHLGSLSLAGVYRPAMLQRLTHLISLSLDVCIALPCFNGSHTLSRYRSMCVSPYHASTAHTPYLAIARCVYRPTEILPSIIAVIVSSRVVRDEQCAVRRLHSGDNRGH
jgi:hypothetical protein